MEDIRSNWEIDAGRGERWLPRVGLGGRVVRIEQTVPYALLLEAPGKYWQENAVFYEVKIIFRGVAWFAVT